MALYSFTIRNGFEISDVFYAINERSQLSPSLVRVIRPQYAIPANHLANLPPTDIVVFPMLPEYCASSTIPARCSECGAVEQVPLADVPEQERNLPVVETCCDDCLERARDEFRAELAMAENCPQESDPNPFIRGVAMFALLICFLSLASPASARDVPAFVTNVPDGCAVQRVFEDHSAMGVCAGGYTVGFDPDDGSWDIPVAVDTMRLTDRAGVVHDVPLYD